MSLTLFLSNKKSQHIIEEKQSLIKEQLKEINDKQKRVEEIQTAISKSLKLTNELKTVFRQGRASYVADDGVVFWFEPRLLMDMNYEEAVHFCETRWSTVAILRDEIEYERIIKLIQDEYTPHGLLLVDAWIGLTLNTTTVKVTPTGSFTQWHSAGPTVSNIGDKGLSAVYLLVSSGQFGMGMLNQRPDENCFTVICQI
uniref:uncharacterized protein LOC120333190 n=1 Tax=Styela clava TaxID=7725 RepID=UPI00193A3A86|nr:uncharacterized protein LOC120333190 [Styela clava]XP_039256493.1 uncharacterized protein LOC120333190 [Styela clava]